jgi:hypothetical protein
MNTSLHEQLIAKCLPHIKHYKDDLLVHDKKAIEDHHGVPFLHWTRECGTQMLLLRPHDFASWPASDNEQAQFLFGQCNRRKMIHELCEIAKYFARPERDYIHLVLHFDGCLLHEITKERAVDIARQWKASVEREWDKQSKRVLAFA